jgi:hypothetical protein
VRLEVARGGPGDLEPTILRLALSSACADLHGLAEASCRHFVRWVEHGKFEREIIYDRDPYRSMI